MSQACDTITSPDGRRSREGGTRSVDALNLITRRCEALHWMGHTTPREGDETWGQEASSQVFEEGQT